MSSLSHGDPPSLGAPLAREQFEDGGLAGTVRPEQAEDLAAVEVEVDIVDRHHPTKALVEATGRQHGVVRSPEVRRSAAARSAAVDGDRRGRGSRRIVGSAQEHGPDDVLAVEQLGRRPGEDHLALLHEDGPIAEPQGEVDGLLDQDDGGAVIVDALDDAQQALDHGGSEPQRELVDDQQFRFGDEGHGEAEHLLLASRE